MKCMNVLNCQYCRENRLTKIGSKDERNNTEKICYAYKNNKQEVEDTTSSKTCIPSDTSAIVMDLKVNRVKVLKTL